MIYLYGPARDRIMEDSVVCVGKFDGLHRGHRLLIDKTREEETRGLVSVALTFKTSPRRFLDQDRFNIVDNRERGMLFERTGISCLLQWEFNEKVARMEPEAFLRQLVHDLSMRTLVVGEDFHFGYRGAGDVETLKQLAPELGFRPLIIPKLKEGGEDISSSRIRRLITGGQIEEANFLLGYDFFCYGEIVHGRKIGRTIGIPTINLSPPEDKLLPRYGVYVTRVVMGTKSYWGMTNVGVKPTIEGRRAPGIETYLMDFEGDIYGREARIDFLHFVRDEKKFEDIKALKLQIGRDREQIARYAGCHPESLSE